MMLSPLCAPSLLLLLLVPSHCADTTAATLLQTPAAPVNLRVDLMDEQHKPLLLVTASVRPAFSFIVPDEMDSDDSMTHYRITVSNIAGGVAWDSGKQPGVAAVNIICGTALKTGGSYIWTARYWAHRSGESTTSEASFDVGLLSEDDWGAAAWLGAGHRQFKMQIPTMPANVTKLKLHVASPGGVTVDVDGGAVGDTVGVSLWADNQRSVHYFSFDLSDVLSSPTMTDVITDCGGGFWASNTSTQTWGHGQDRDMQPGLSACKFLLVADGKAGQNVLLRSGDDHSVLGRPGPILADDPWRGTTTDTTLDISAGWAPALVAPDTPTGRPAGKLFPLPAPFARVKGGALAVSITAVPQRPGTLLYSFPANIVGHASVKPGAATGSGNLTLEYCEVWDHDLGGCVPLLPPFTVRNGSRPVCSETIGAWNAGCDTFVLDSDSSQELNPKFTWHSFQYVLVRPGPGVTFSGAADALLARWSGADVKETGTIEFGGEGAAVLSSIRDITKASQRSNVVAFQPTDCPSREKHGWTGDSQVTAEEAMYNMWLPTTFRTFLRNIRDSQITDQSAFQGFIAPNLPVLQGTCGNLAPDGGMDGQCVLPTSDGHQADGLDLSWTAAYPLIVGWLVKYYDDVNTAREYWPSLNAFMAGQMRMAEQVTPDGLVNFWNYGDWKALDPLTLESAGQLAAANWLLALQQVVSVAAVLGEESDALRYRAVYNKSVAIFDERYWNQTLGSWTHDQNQLQTVNAISLGAGVGSQERRSKAVEALEADIVARNFHLTFGSVGAKWVLRTLSEEGRHDTALQLAMQTSYPSWGWWISKNATTCWESWTGINGPDEGKLPQQQGGQATHNHIFLCGGVGEWQYEYLAGIVPSSPGYATVRIKPLVSKTHGPSSVSAAVTTVRGVVASNWTRNGAIHDTDSLQEGVQLLVLHVTIPAAVQSAEVHIPLLGLHAHEVTVRNGTDQVLSLCASEEIGLSNNRRQHQGESVCLAVQAVDGVDEIFASVTAGAYSFIVAKR
jgi:alpha-L-rhamnosidase